MKTFVVTFRNKKTREEIEVMYVENSFDKVYKLAKLAIKEQYTKVYEIKNIVEQ
jgi:hypothetical protein